MMTTTNPLRTFHEDAEATFLSYGSPGPPGGAGDAGGGGGEDGVEIVESFQEYEAEYAAIRKSVGVFDMPQRAVLLLRGGDRLDFLHRLTTNDIDSLKPGEGRRAFVLNNQGRIQADLIVLHEQQQTLLVLDVFQAEPIAAELDKMLFSEDVQIENAAERYHHLALHGPGAAGLISEVSGGEDVAALDKLAHRSLNIEGQPCYVYRHDDAGSLGLHLIVPAEGISTVYRRLMTALDWDPSREDDEQTRAHRRGRPIGWLAYNTARIEAGSAIYHIDFGPDTLPNETGPALLSVTVSFTKGCYVGQEIVARLQNLGHPKRLLVELKLPDDRMPIAGSQVLGGDEDDGDVIGAVTSSTVSPLRGNVAVALAMVQWDRHEPGTVVRVPAEGQIVCAVVQPLAKA